MIDKLIITLPQEPPESDSNPEPEEQTCKKCLEVESECECAYFDQLEAEELKAIRKDRLKASNIFKVLGETQVLLNNL